MRASLRVIGAGLAVAGVAAGLRRVALWPVAAGAAAATYLASLHLLQVRGRGAPRPGDVTMAAGDLVRRRLGQLQGAATGATGTHRFFAGAVPASVADEVRGSRAELEDLTGAPVDRFAYPGGHHNAAVRAAAQEAAYTAGYTFLNGRVTAGLDRFRLPRLNMWSGQGRVRLAYHLIRPAHSWPDTQEEAVDG